MQPFTRREFLTTTTLALTLPHLAHAQPQATIPWQTWAQGSQRAAAEHKAIGLLIYADWCPHCRELEPLLREAEIVKLAHPLIMIRQNADEHAEWVTQRFGRLGTYVPRLFFLHPDGSIAEEIQSGNTRFPYFYQPHQPETLRSALKRAAALAGKHG